MSKLLNFTLGLGCLGGLACEYAPAFEEALDISGPVATDAALTWVDHGREELVFFVPRDDDYVVRRRALTKPGERVLWNQPTLDRSELLVLGGPADAKQEEVEETLYRLPADGDGDAVEYDVLAPFTGLALSPDGAHGVLYFSGTDTDAPLNNANEVSIVDLEGSEARNLTLNGFGGRVRDVQFPGRDATGEPSPVDVGGISRDIVTFLADGEIVLVDMLNEGADQVAVRFGDTGNFNPTQTLLRPAGGGVDDPALFVRSANSADVAMLFLKDKPDEETGEPGFTASINLVPVGAGVTDFLHHDEDEVPYLITANATTQRFAFTDIRTQESFDVGAEGPVTEIFLRDQARGDLTVRQLVGWARGSTEIHTLDLDGIGSSIGRRPRHLKVERGIDDLVVLDNDRVLVGAGTVLYVVDISKEQVTPLESKAPYDPRSSALDDQILLLGTPGQPWVSTVDLEGLNPESMLLDDTIADFFYLSAAGKVVTTHIERFGHLTVADARDPSRGDAYVAWGFLLEGILD